MRITALIAVFAWVTTSLAAQTPEQVLARALAYHDPAGEWSNLSAELRFAETRPKGDDTQSVIRLDNRRTYMHIDFSGKEAYEITGQECVIIKGDKDAERGLSMRNYFLYLWGLPMKLQDPGTHFDPTIESSVIDGAPCDVIRVTYEKDFWYFHIDRSSGRMRQYEFYWDEEKTKGEIITLAEEFELAGMRIPKVRTWYKLPGNELLGTDTLVSAQLISP